MKKNTITIFLLLVIGILAAHPALGDIVINEIMKDPSSVSDTNGEWFEIFNDAGADVDINGWTLRDNDGEMHTINNGGALIVPAGGYAVLCRNANSAANGGVACAYQYSGFTLGNDDDEIIILNGAAEVDRVEYERVTFPDPTGASLEFSAAMPALTANDLGSNWGTALAVFGAGDRGTPGFQNNEPPLFGTIPPTTAVEDSFYMYTVTAIDPNGDSITFGSLNLPNWLTFDPATRVLSGTPTNSDVGTTLPFSLTASDGGAPASVQTFSITIANVNDAPVVQSVSTTTNEDTEIIITLPYSDADLFDQAESVSVSNVVNGVISTPASCISGVCTVGLTPSLNSNAQITAQFTVNDGESDSNAGAITINVNPINDAPVITAVPLAAQAVEGVSFTGLLVSATDVDNPQLDLVISEIASSLPTWLFVDYNTPLQLEGMPRQADIGTSSFPVRITDGQDLSSEATLTINVLPALQILDSAFTVQINGQPAGIPIDAVPVAPGDTVTIGYAVKNNYDHSLGNVQTTAQVVTGTDFINYQTSQAVLPSGSTAAGQFTFQVPANFASNTFDVRIHTIYDNFWSFLFGYDFESQRILGFDVSRQPTNIILASLTASSANLTCSRTTTLNLDLANTGQFDITPTVLVYDKQAVSTSFDPVTGHFTLFNGGTPSVRISAPLAQINAGTQSTQTVAVNTANVSQGQQTLYIYVTSPYFNPAQSFVGASGSVNLNIGSCITAFAPTASSMIIGQGIMQQFSIVLDDPGLNSDIKWFIDNIEVTSAAGSNAFDFQQNTAGNYVIKGTIHTEGKSWQVRVVDRPSSVNFQTNIPAAGTINNRTNFNLQVENNAAKILFSDGIDLDALIAADMLSLDNLITLTANTVSVDAQSGNPFAGEKATITFKRTFTNPIIQTAPGYNTQSGFIACPATQCTFISNQNGEFIFEVNSFSTYQVLSTLAADLQLPSEVVFDNVVRGTNANVNVTIQNIGTTEQLTNLQVQFLNVNSQFNPQILSSPASLNPNEQQNISLKISVPGNQASGKNKIGDLQVTALNGSGGQVTKTTPIFVKPQTFLTIKSIEINGKSRGDLELDEENEIEVEVENTYTKDIDDASVTVEIIDVGGDDLEEESDSFDLSVNDHEKVTLKFNLRQEDVDEDTYKIRVKAQGEADDGTDHEDQQEITVSVKRDRHKIVISKAVLGSSDLQCVRQTNLQVTIENSGRSDEDDLEVRISNPALGLEMKRTNLELDDYSGSDNEEKITFNLDVEEAENGTYPVKVALYQDGKVEDEEEVSLRIVDCARLQNEDQTIPVRAEGRISAEELQQQLEARRQVQQQSPEKTPIVRTSFRGSDEYLILLAGLTLAVLIALVLALALLFMKRK